MKNYFEYYKSLSPDEFNSFGKFLNSPFLNSNEKAIKFYSFLKKNFDKFSETGLSKDEIKKKFYHVKTLEDDNRAEVNLRKLMSDFNKLFEKFLAYFEFERKSGYKKILLLHTLRKRKLDNLFESNLSEFEEEFSQNHINDRYYIRKKVKEEAKIYKFSNDYHSASESVQNESDALDLYFISEKLELFQNMFSMEYINKGLKQDWKFYDEIMLQVEKDSDRIRNEAPSVFFNYAMLKLVTNSEDKKIFSELKEFILDCKTRIRPTELKGMTFDLINYCYLKHTEGFKEYREEMQTLLEFLDENNLMVADGELKYAYFKTAVENSLSLRKFDWLENFTSKYSKYIDQEYRDSLKNLTLANLNFYRGDYAKTRFYQSKVDYKNFIFYTDAKMLLSCVEYEEENDDGVYLIFDSLKKFFKKRTDITDSYINSYRNFMKYLTALTKIRQNINRGIDSEFELFNLKKKLESEPKKFYRCKWLLEKTEQLNSQIKMRDRSPA